MLEWRKSQRKNIYVTKKSISVRCRCPPTVSAVQNQFGWNYFRLYSKTRSNSSHRTLLLYLRAKEKEKKNILHVWKRIKSRKKNCIGIFCHAVGKCITATLVSISVKTECYSKLNWKYSRWNEEIRCWRRENAARSVHVLCNVQ
jgi:hypothetical protein